MNVKRVLFVRNDLIGDFVLWLDSLEYLRKNYAGAHLTLVCNEKYTEIAESINVFDHVIGINVTQLMKYDIKLLFNTVLRLRKFHFDVVICPQYTRNVIVDFLVVSLKACRRIGIDAYYGKLKFFKSFFDCFYDQLYQNTNLIQMELGLNIDFINYLFKTKYSANLPDFNAFELKQHIESICGDKVVISLGSSNLKKNWPLDNFARLIEKIVSTEKVLLIGGHHEVDMANYVMSKIHSINLSSQVGETNLFGVIKLIKTAKLFIGNDSALVHIAAALHVPSVCFLGGGHFGRFLPYAIPRQPIKEEYLPTILYHRMECYGCSWNCRLPLANEKTWQCVASISVDEAVQVVKNKLEQINRLS